MPLYFFHLSFGERFILDEEGVEFPNRSAARDEALAVVRELANPAIEGARRRWASWFLHVADERGGFFRTPLGHPALEIVTRDGHVFGAEEPKSRPARAKRALGAPVRSRTAEIVRQMSERRQRTAQLIEENQQLRSELLSLYRASERMPGAHRSRAVGVI